MLKFKKMVTHENKRAIRWRGRGTGQSYQMSHGGWRELAKVSRDIFPEFLKYIFCINLFGKENNCHYYIIMIGDFGGVQSNVIKCHMGEGGV